MVMELNMFKNFQRPHLLWLAAIIVFLALSRLIPHAPNFTPIGAMALLAGACIQDIKLAWLIPLTAMLLSDAIIGFHSSMLYVYGSVALIVFCSHYWLNRITFISLLVAAISSAIIFFAITNFGAWLSHDMYAHNLMGLTQAYMAGIPFFRNTLISNLIFTLVAFFASQQWINKPLASN